MAKRSSLSENLRLLLWLLVTILVYTHGMLWIARMDYETRYKDKLEDEENSEMKEYAWGIQEELPL